MRVTDNLSDLCIVRLKSTINSSKARFLSLQKKRKKEKKRAKSLEHGYDEWKHVNTGIFSIQLTSNRNKKKKEHILTNLVVLWNPLFSHPNFQTYTHQHYTKITLVHYLSLHKEKKKLGMQSQSCIHIINASMPILKSSPFNSHQTETDQNRTKLDKVC